jgi:hypothetical protein
MTKRKDLVCITLSPLGKFAMSAMHGSSAKMDPLSVIFLKIKKGANLWVLAEAM